MKKILFILSLLSLAVYAQIPNTKQLLVVSTSNWETSSGVLQRYEKSDKKWKKVGKSIKIKLGRNGLGWGRGLHKIPKNAKIIKKEGDGKAPAGIFSLKQGFGYAPFDIDYPYEVYSTQNHCVDDVNSKLYNKIVDSKKVKIDYKSKETMKFPKNYYKYGIVVNHNNIDEKGAKAGAGSCIFIHIKETATAGCTVMKEAQMKALMRWLNPQSNPLLIQGTVAVVNSLLKKVIY
ncbi:Gll0911 protein [hydrothermal vent metagenome]|uniref:Gll0911 protein n=1 Tax=hydrothermal vent metagenome TaxID=652676 RepID=A0A1W1CPK2_9ZZZZ